MVLKFCPTNESDVSSLQYATNNSSRRIFNFKSKNMVLECEIAFRMLPVSDFINIRKKNFSLVRPLRQPSMPIV